MLSETNEPMAGQREAVERFEAVTDTALAQLSLDDLALSACGFVRLG